MLAGMGSRLRAARVQAGIRSQIELAQRLGVSRETVQRAETDVHVPELETLIAWARICGVSLDDLVCAPAGSDDAEAAQ